MRLWLIHPKYLDTKGLGGQWLESLWPARNPRKYVDTKFPGANYLLNKATEDTNLRIIVGCYREEIYKEAVKRGFNYNQDLIYTEPKPEQFDYNNIIDIPHQAITEDYKDLAGRLDDRAPGWLDQWSDEKEIQPHPIFNVPGGNPWKPDK